MKKIVIILCFLSFDTFANSKCLDVIKADKVDEIIQSCFRAKKDGETLQQAILYEELENDFGSFREPTEAYKLLKLKAENGSPKIRYILAQSIMFAHKMSMPRFLGRDDLVTDSRDLTDENTARFESYSKMVEEEYNKWLLLSGNHEQRLPKRIGSHAAEPD